jgi:hypothetical protein
MKLPPFVTAMGVVGLTPVFISPLWWAIAPQTAPAQLDHLWIIYTSLVASFMAGTFWGFALPAIEGTEGQIGMVIASVLMLLTWGSMALSFGSSLYGLMGVFLLLLLADFWRERTLGSVEGYFAFRTALTLAAIAALVWRAEQL